MRFRTDIVIGAAVLVGLTALLCATPATAAKPGVAVRVYDSQTRPVKDVPVHFYEGSAIKCHCPSGTCVINPDATAKTKGGGKAQTKKGDLKALTNYIACAGDDCQDFPCPGGDPDCAGKGQGKCVSVSTNSSGGSKQTYEITLDP